MLGLEPQLLPVFPDIGELDGPARRARKRQRSPEYLPPALAVGAIDDHKSAVFPYHGMRGLLINLPGIEEREDRREPFPSPGKIRRSEEHTSELQSPTKL